jgi:hypothetical protein
MTPNMADTRRREEDTGGARARGIVAMVAALATSTGCSFAGARVPDHIPPGYECPQGVVVADGLGVGVFGVGIGLYAYAGSRGGYNAMAAAIMLPPLILLELIYLPSLLYGLSKRSDCEEKLAAMAAAEIEDAKRRANAPERPRTTGNEPVFCAITEPDVGACFFAAAACEAALPATPDDAERISCEVRARTWCFDVRPFAAPPTARPLTQCAASPIDCEARRVPFASDKFLTTTGCGIHETSAPAPPE